MKKLVALEIFNEFLLLIVNYHLLTFTVFNLEPMRRFMMGWSFLGALAVIVIVNIAYVIHGQILKIKRKKYLKKAKSVKIFKRR
jgi:ABC-type dipeptide/oligopeptide/nickel transport system permease subunit